MASGANRVVISPFARIDGDIRVHATVENGVIAEARVTGACFRGFETLLRGREARDAMVITPRVCGQCSLSHLAAAAGALGSLAGARPPRNGLLSTAVMLGAETVLNHVSHFYLSFAPDLAAGAGDDEDLARFRPTSGASFRAAMEARTAFLPFIGLFAGKWPNSLAIQPGGTTRPMDRGDLTRAAGVIFGFKEFVESRFLGSSLSTWLGLRSDSDLADWLTDRAHAASDLGVFVRTLLEGSLSRLGCGPDMYLSCGGYEYEDGRRWLRPGSYEDGSAPLSLDCVSEHMACSWFDPSVSDLHPTHGKTVPAPDREGAYSWIKAPRYRGRPAETGPLARMIVDRDPLIVSLTERHGAVAFVRELARLHEMIRLVDRISAWIAEIRPGEPFLCTCRIPDSGEGAGLVEAPRGMLGHWVSLVQGKIREYQIVTPTAWNFSPRDENGVPGPVESALVGVRIGGAAGRVEAQLVVKSFDPCLFCAVH